jgi:hypothetical protein
MYKFEDVFMPLPVNWHDDEHSIIVATIRKDTIWEEYHQAVEWIVTEAATVDHRVDTIFHDNVGMPKGNPMPHLKRGSGIIIKQPNIQLTIIAGSQGYSGFGRMMLEVLAKMYMRQSKQIPSSDRTLMFMRTLEDALVHIQKDRAKLSTAR